jgi:hypothetical protein
MHNFGFLLDLVPSGVMKLTKRLIFWKKISEYKYAERGERRWFPRPSPNCIRNQFVSFVPDGTSPPCPISPTDKFETVGYFFRPGGLEPSVDLGLDGSSNKLNKSDKTQNPKNTKKIDCAIPAVQWSTPVKPNIAAMNAITTQLAPRLNMNQLHPRNRSFNGVCLYQTQPRQRRNAFRQLWPRPRKRS